MAYGAGELATRILPSLANPGNRDQSATSRHLQPGVQPFHFVPDKILGYAHPPATKLALKKTHGDETVYDVLCTIDAAGRRITPLHDQARKAVLLFGDSFTFGDGLEDDQTFASRLSGLLGEQWQVFNYGVSGYGAHQVLAQIESGRIPFETMRQDYGEIRAYFLTIRDHPRRACRHFSYGPAYVADAAGLRSAGLLPLSRHDHLATLISASTLLETIYPLLVDKAATRLHVAILRECAMRLERWGISFTVLLWPDFAELRPGLEAAHVQVLDLAPFFGEDGKDWGAGPGRWRLSVWDRHPNAAAAQIIAEAIAASLLNQ